MKTTINGQPAILSLATSLPSRRYSQQEIYDLTCRFSEFYRNPRIQQLFMNSDIDYRHFYLDFDQFDGMETRDQLHDRFRRGAVEIGTQAIAQCLEDGGLKVSDIDCIVVATCTGYLCPGLTSIFIKEMGFRRDVQRADLVGMGCAGAMPALQSASNFVASHPGKKALVVAVEVCSACYFFDETLETIVGNAICADGAAAAVLGAGADHGAPRILGFETQLEPEYIESVGFENRDGRFRIVLSKDIRDLAGGLACRLVQQLLGAHGIRKEEISHWIIHSGGRKVIDAIQRELGLVDGQIRNSRTVLRNFGNMSSPTVLFVLQEAFRGSGNGHAPKPGDLGVMLALGPGLAVEGALLAW